MKPMLEARGVTKHYRQGTSIIAAVDRVSIAVREGEIALIIGPSGSGKSTLLSMLGCILQPTSGAVLVAGYDVSGLSERVLPRIRQRCFGFVFQSFHLFPFLTARENVEATLRLQKVPREARRELAADLLSGCGLGQRMDFYPASLSGGEKQRVAIARVPSSVGARTSAHRARPTQQRECGARLYVNAVSRRSLSHSASYSMTIAWSLAAATGAWRSSSTSGIAASDSTIISLKSSM
jgi:predicted ABC-type transport system involved in lysophospholipase L1 biosynthesis ATPase subunit